MQMCMWKLRIRRFAVLIVLVDVLWKPPFSGRAHSSVVPLLGHLLKGRPANSVKFCSHYAVWCLVLGGDHTPNIFGEHICECSCMFQASLVIELVHHHVFFFVTFALRAKSERSACMLRDSLPRAAVLCLVSMAPCGAKGNLSERMCFVWSCLFVRRVACTQLFCYLQTCAHTSLVLVTCEHTPQPHDLELHVCPVSCIGRIACTKKNPRCTRSLGPRCTYFVEISLRCRHCTNTGDFCSTSNHTQ